MAKDLSKIIIDGVDVSGCEQYRAEIETKMPYGEYEIQKDKCHYSGIEIIQNCKGNKGCIYKQLKRKEQECEELKNKLICESVKVRYVYSTTNQYSMNEVAELKAENERLKKQYNCYACDSCSGKEDYINMKRHTENAIKTVHKYRQALQEIKDIVSEPCIVDENCQICNSGCMQKDILAKINEVIGVE